jgi:predicted XRE-type DNA-binding protein
MLESESWHKLPRPELISRASELGVERAERMTRLELVDEILRRTQTGAEQIQARGLFGVARAMVANVMESGLNLPDAAALIRGTAHFGARVEPRAPVATVTLAEIYAAQGHRDRALAVLNKVLLEEPEHAEALRLKAEFSQSSPQVATLSGQVESPLSTDYEPPATLETTGEEIRTGEPPTVAPVLPALPPSQGPLLPDPLSPDPNLLPTGLAAEDPEMAAASLPLATKTPTQLGLSWEGSTLWVDWSLQEGAQPGAQYCIMIVAFERNLGLPIRHELLMPLPEGSPGSRGRVRFDEFARSTVCAALGVVGEGESFSPVATSPTLEPAPDVTSPPFE